MSEYMKISEVAKLMGISPAHVYRLVHSHTIPAVYLQGIGYRIPKLAWEQFHSDQNAIALASVREKEEAVL